MTATQFRISPIALIIPLCLCACVALCAAPAKAESLHGAAQPETQSVSIAFTPSQQFDANFKNGGTVGVSRYYLDINANKAVSETLGLGINVGYELADFRFTSPTSFYGIKPWGMIHRMELGGSVAYDLTPIWSIYVTPTIMFSREDGAGWSNAMAYGGDATITRDFTPSLTLGLGLEGYSELDSVSILPLIIVNWKITDKLLLTNPSHSGPTGQTGFELAYRIDGGWEVATGISYLSNRFRLNNTKRFSEGIVGNTSFPTWGRLSCKAGRNFNLDLYGGAMLGGWMSIDDSGGNRIASDSYDAAPFLALALTGRF